MDPWWIICGKYNFTSFLRTSWAVTCGKYFKVRKLSTNKNQWANASHSASLPVAQVETWSPNMWVIEHVNNLLAWSFVTPQLNFERRVRIYSGCTFAYRSLLILNGLSMYLCFTIIFIVAVAKLPNLPHTKNVLRKTAQKKNTSRKYWVLVVSGDKADTTNCLVVSGCRPNNHHPSWHFPAKVGRSWLRWLEMMLVILLILPTKARMVDYQGQDGGFWQPEIRPVWPPFSQKKKSLQRL